MYERDFNGALLQAQTVDGQVVVQQTTAGTYGRGAAALTAAEARELGDALHALADQAEADAKAIAEAPTAVG